MRFIDWLYNRLRPRPQPPAPPSGNELLDRHNHQRAARGIPPLVFDARLAAAAQKWAQHMATTGRLEHGSVGPRLRAEGWSGRTWGENIAAGQRTFDEVMASWMSSTGHRSNILNGSFRAAGFGAAMDARGVRYWCADFGG